MTNFRFSASKAVGGITAIEIVSIESPDFAPPPTKMILGDRAKVKLVKRKWGALIL